MHLLLMDMKSSPCLFILCLSSHSPTLSTRPFVAQMQHYMLLHHPLHDCSFQANVHLCSHHDRSPLIIFTTWLRAVKPEGMRRKEWTVEENRARMDVISRWSVGVSHNEPCNVIYKKAVINIGRSNHTQQSLDCVLKAVVFTFHKCVISLHSWEAC